jgi:hypothetical protein
MIADERRINARDEHAQDVEEKPVRALLDEP